MLGYSRLTFASGTLPMFVVAVRGLRADSRFVVHVARPSSTARVRQRFAEETATDFILGASFLFDDGAPRKEVEASQSQCDLVGSPWPALEPIEPPLSLTTWRDWPRL